jgi:ribosomal protein S18 acetylase RimI-like enzyme
VPVQLGVVHFNARAIAFYKKLGFEDTGRPHGRHLIPRLTMVRVVPKFTP